MEVLHWLHYLESFEGLIVTLGLLLTAYTIRKDERARRISNTLIIYERFDQLWGKIFSNTDLERILKEDVDLQKQPVSAQESVWVKMMLLHLDVVRRASREGMFIKLEKLKFDVRQFMSRPIAKAVWERLKPFQDNEFIVFVEDCMKSE